MTLGERLKSLREEQNISREDLAQKLGISYWALSKYENDEREPNNALLAQFADYFHVSTDYLLGRTNIRIPPSQLADSVYAAHRDDGYDKPLDPETLAYIDAAVEEAFRKREEWLKKRKSNKGE